MVNHPDDHPFDMPAGRQQPDTDPGRSPDAASTSGAGVNSPGRGDHPAGGRVDTRTRERPGDMTDEGMLDEDEAVNTAWQQRARAVFDESVERLDARTRSKLTQARFAALDALGAAEARQRGWRLPVAGAVAATVAAVAVLTWSGDSRLSTPGELPLEDMELVADAVSLELLQDVEFYAWLGGQ